MAYLIDGNNLLGYTSPHELATTQGKQKLVSQLYTYYKFKKKKVIVVFDGPPDVQLDLAEFRKKKFKVVFPPPGENADKIIKGIIESQTEKRHFFVVSSDRELRNFAKSRGVKALKSSDFQKELKGVLKKQKKRAEYEKHAEPPSSFEIDHWIEIFDKKDE